MLIFCLKKTLLLIAIMVALHFTAAAQTSADSSKSKAENYRSIITHFFNVQASVRYVYQTTLNAQGTAIAWSADGDKGQTISFTTFSNPDKVIKVSASPSDSPCNETEPQWSPDGKEIAFLSNAQTPDQLQIFVADAGTGALLTKQPLTHFNGYISHLRWSPDGQYLSVLYVEKASREPSPMAAENRTTGIIDSMVNNNVQCIAIMDRHTGMMQTVTPEGLYVFEYDWSPSSKQFAYTAAPPPGDDNWYIAKIYKQSISDKDTTLIYAPTYQIALPRWSPDGKRIAYIEGLMSDQGGTGGEIYTIATNGGEQPKNLTPNRSSTPSWFRWQKDGNMLFTEFTGGSVAISTLNVGNGATQTLWKGDEYLRAGNEEMSLSVGENKAGWAFAVIRSSWNQLPEVWCGNTKKLTQITHLNKDIHKPVVRAQNITWTNEQLSVQGWLLYPQQYDSTRKYPMVVCVHGGPAWISTPTWSAPDFNTTVYTQLGYFVFFPNPRGSHGQGEQFTMANRRDWGFGDLRDITTGVDTLIARLPVDSSRVGILGWSYGGSMAMMAITQTNKFKAAVAGAGAADWLSYYGQNRIDKWMGSYFGASPYDDAAAYQKVSAMTYIKEAKTPTLVLVGERDGEAPSPQSFQFWHALKELGVPTQLVVYADEGHSFEKLEDMIDVSVRTIEWFERWMR